MATLVGDIRGTEETALSFKPGGSHIQIDSISIEISSGEINEAVEECNHFSIRGFVRDQRNKDRRLRSPFISDGDGEKSNNNKISSFLELPPLDVHKFKWWRCSGCLQDCNSSQGEGSDSKDEIEKSLSWRRRNKFLQNQETGSLSSSLLFAKATGGCSNVDHQRSAAKGKQLVEEEEEEGLNLKEKRLAADYSQSRAKDSFNTDDAFSTGLDCFSPRPSWKSATLNKKGRASGSDSISKVVMGPPKSALKQRSTTLSAAHGTSRSTSANLNKQNIWKRPKPAQTTTTPPAATMRKMTNYAIRSVQQPDSAAKGGDLRIPQSFNQGQVTPPQLDRNQELGSSSKFVEKVCNYSTIERAPERGQSHEFVKDGDFYPHNDKILNSVRPLVESNRLLKRPRTDVELEGAGRNSMYVHLRRGPKIRLLSDVIAKYPDNVSMKRKVASPFACTSEERNGVSDKTAAVQSAKSKSPPFVSHYDSPPGRGVSVSSGSCSKRKRSTVRFADPADRTACPTTPRFNRPGLDLSAQTAFTAEANNAFHTTVVENKSKKTTVQNASPSSIPSPPRHMFIDNCEIPLPSNSFSLGQAAVSRPLHGGQATDGARHKSNKNIYYPDKVDKRIQGSGEKNTFPPIGKDYQPATKFLQFGPEYAPEHGTSIIGGRLTRRNDEEENCENSSSPSPTMTDDPKTSISTSNDLWISQTQAGGTLVECKGGEKKGIKRRVKDIDINSIPVDDKTPEPGSADDIPMDIVELLAKLQEHERHSDLNREKLSMQEEVSGGEKSSAQKSNSSCLLKPQASYSFSISYSNNGVGRPFDPISTGSAEKNIQSDQRRKNGCVNDDPLVSGAQFSGGAVKSWNGNMGPFRPASRLQQGTQSLFNRLPPSRALNTQMWMPGNISSSSRIGSDLGQLGMYMTTQSELNSGNPKPSSSATQSWTYPDYTAAVENGRQNKTQHYVPPPKETIPAMQLLNLVQVAGRSKFPFGSLDNQHQYSKKMPPPYAPGPHFEPYNKPTSSTTGGGGGTSRPPLYDGECASRSSLVDMLCPCSPAQNAAIPSQGAHICVTNTNPADMIMDFKQVRSFMINPEDLRRRRKPTLPPKASTVY